jgi:DHA1 family bicyclomycin/chloramphenicol resistance-like MFS transporter
MCIVVAIEGHPDLPDSEPLPERQLPSEHGFSHADKPPAEHDADLPTEGHTLSSLTIAVLALLTAVAPLATDMYLPGFPSIERDLRTSASAVQLSLTTFLIGIAAGQLLIGTLSDQWGRRRLLIWGTIICALAGAGCALAPNILTLSSLRFLQGFSGAAGIVLSRAVIADRAKGITLTHLFGVLMTIQGLGPVLAPLFGGILVDTVGWRGVFWTITALTAVMICGTFVAVPETLPARSRHAGGFTILRRQLWTVLRNRRYLGYSLSNAFAFGTMMAYLSASSFVLQDILGLSTIVYSAVVAINAFGLIGANICSTVLARRIPIDRQLRVAVSMLALASLLLLVDVAAAHLPLWPTLILLFASIGSLGFVFNNAASLATSEAVHAAGTGSAFLGAAQFGIGAIVSPLVGLAGSKNALPMAIVMLVAAVTSVTALVVLTRQTLDARSVCPRETGGARRPRR